MEVWLKEKLQLTEFESILKSYTYEQKAHFLDFASSLIQADSVVKDEEAIWIAKIAMMLEIDFNSYLSNNNTYEDAINGIKTFNSDQLDIFLSSMVTGALSDGELALEEEELLDYIMSSLKISPERLEYAINRVNAMAIDTLNKRLS